MPLVVETARPKKHAFAPGDRVRYNALGRLRSPKSADRAGIVCRVSKSGSALSIRFDGSVERASIHWTYLELVREQP